MSADYMDVYRWLRQHPGSTQPEVRRAFNFTVKEASNRLTYLRTVKKLVRMDHDHGYHAIDAEQLRTEAIYVPQTVEPNDLEGLTADGVVVELVRLRWPEFIPTEKLATILEWRDLTARLLA